MKQEQMHFDAVVTRVKNMLVKGQINLSNLAKAVSERGAEPEDSFHLQQVLGDLEQLVEYLAP